MLASDKPAENPEELRLQGRGLHEPLDAGDDAAAVLPRSTRFPRAPGEEQRSTLQPILGGFRERPDAGDDETSVLPRAGQQPAKNPRSSPRRQGRGFLERPDTSDDASSVTGPLTVEQPGDQAFRDSAEAVHRQRCSVASGDAPTGPSGSDCAGDAAGAVHRQRERACDHAGDQVCRDSADSAHRQGRRRAGGLSFRLRERRG